MYAPKEIDHLKKQRLDTPAFDQDFLSFGMPSPKSIFSSNIDNSDKKFSRLNEMAFANSREYYESKIEEVLSENISLTQRNLTFQEQVIDLRQEIEKWKGQYEKCKAKKKELKAQLLALKSCEIPKITLPESNIPMKMPEPTIPIQMEDTVVTEEEKNLCTDQEAKERTDMLENEIYQMRAENKDLIMIVDRMERLMEQKEMMITEARNEAGKKDLHLTEFQNFLLKTNVTIETLFDFGINAQTGMDALWKRTSDNLSRLESHLMEVARKQKESAFFEEQISVYLLKTNELTGKIRDLQGEILQKDGQITFFKSQGSILEDSVKILQGEKTVLDQRVYHLSDYLVVFSDWIQSVLNELIDHEEDPKRCSTVISASKYVEAAVKSLQDFQSESNATNLEIAELTKKMKKPLSDIPAILRNKLQANLSNPKQSNKDIMSLEASSLKSESKDFDALINEELESTENFYFVLVISTIKSFKELIMSFTGTPQLTKVRDHLLEILDFLRNYLESMQAVNKELKAVKDKRQAPILTANELQILSNKQSFLESELSKFTVAIRKLFFKLGKLISDILLLTRSPLEAKNPYDQHTITFKEMPVRSTKLNNEEITLPINQRPTREDFYLTALVSPKQVDGNCLIATEFYQHKSDESHLMKILLE